MTTGISLAYILWSVVTNLGALLIGFWCAYRQTPFWKMMVVVLAWSIVCAAGYYVILGAPS